MQNNVHLNEIRYVTYQFLWKASFVIGGNEIVLNITHAEAENIIRSMPADYDITTKDNIVYYSFRA